MTKTVGIITYNSISNYGALFQAHALQMILEKKGYTTEFIDYWPSYRLTRIIQPPLMHIKKGEGVILNLLMTFYRLYADIINIDHNYRKPKLFLSYHNDYLHNSKIRYNTYDELVTTCPSYDIYITGSDQLWRPREIIGLDPAYFLAFVNKQNCRISYAVSMGSDKLSDKYTEHFKSLIKNVDVISVREKAAIPFVHNMSGKDVVSVLDPTLLVDITEWNLIAKEPKKHICNFLLVYNLSGDSGLGQIAKKVADKLNLHIIHINRLPYGMRFPRQNAVRPEEWLWYFSNASFIITDSFHGTVFSILNNKPFYTIQPAPRNMRALDLLTPLGLSQRLYSSWKDVEIDAPEINYSSVMNKLDQMRKASYSYLDDAITTCTGDT